MPIGPNGEKRPADVIANAVHVMKVLTGEAEEEYVNAGQSAGGRKGGAARAAKLTAAERSEIGRQGAAARWNKPPDNLSAGQPDSPTARQPDSPTARQPDSPK